MAATTLFSVLIAFLIAEGTLVAVVPLDVRLVLATPVAFPRRLDQGGSRGLPTSRPTDCSRPSSPAPLLPSAWERSTVDGISVLTDNLRISSRGNEQPEAVELVIDGVARRLGSALPRWARGDDRAFAERDIRVKYKQTALGVAWD